MRERNGFVVVFSNGEKVYEGYVLNGQKFIIVAPILNMVWYRGLLSDVEWENLRLGNPHRYAYEKFGEEYLKHLKVFTERVLEEVRKRFNEEDLREEFVAMPEDYVREILGFPVEEVKIAEETRESRSAEQIKRTLMALGYTNYYINGDYGEGNRNLAYYTEVCEAIKEGDTAFLLLYPKRLVLVGRLGDTHFVAVTPGINTAINTLLQFPPGHTIARMRGAPVSRFKNVGVPMAKVVALSKDRLQVSTLRHVGQFINVEDSIEIKPEDISRLLRSYKRWLSKVEGYLKNNPPSHMTLPAWRKIVAAYLDDYPHPDDFRRMLSVLTYGEVEIPECEGTNDLKEVKGTSSST